MTTTLIDNDGATRAIEATGLPTLDEARLEAFVGRIIDGASGASVARVLRAQLFSFPGEKTKKSDEKEK